MLKELIPLYIKAPLGTVLKEYHYVPLKLLRLHALKVYADSRGFPQERKERIDYKLNTETHNYISEKYLGVLEPYTNNYYQGTRPNEKCIWVFWWQGENKAPLIVKKCIDSIRRNAGNMIVKIIDSENYTEYVNVSDHIMMKMQKGIISLTHFSDYYRMALLAKHGGLWIDASLFVKTEIPACIFESPLFTVRNPGKDQTNISQWNWTVGAIGGWSGNTLFCAVRDLLDRYWLENDYLIDYFIFDHMVRLVYETIDGVRNWITEIPENNADFYYLQDHLNHNADPIYDLYLSQNTWLYKVSWKGKYMEVTDDGRQTVYGKWLESIAGRGDKT